MSPAGAQPVAVLDAVCCVQFCAAQRHRLLLTLLVELGWEIFIPGEVDAEVRGKRGKYPTLTDPWRRLTASARVHVLDVIDLHRPDQAAVRDTVARLRGTTAALALGATADLGEHIVVGHARVLADAGRDVTVLIDDDRGQQMATDEGWRWWTWRRCCCSATGWACPTSTPRARSAASTKTCGPTAARCCPGRSAGCAPSCEPTRPPGLRQRPLTLRAGGAHRTPPAARRAGPGHCARATVRTGWRAPAASAERHHLTHRAARSSRDRHRQAAGRRWVDRTSTAVAYRLRSHSRV